MLLLICHLHVSAYRLARFFLSHGQPAFGRLTFRARRIASSADIGEGSTGFGVGGLVGMTQIVTVAKRMGIAGVAIF
jgi:hypothetical protein